jgi:hypothetical protein
MGISCGKAANGTFTLNQTSKILMKLVTTSILAQFD